MDIAFDDKRERTLALLFVLVALAALALGGLAGLFQALEHASVPVFPLPLLGTYYQALTLSGVLNSLAWTTFFTSGFLLIAQGASLKRASAQLWLSWIGFVLMLAGLLMAVYAVLTGSANVLVTFYAPMKASAIFYIGLAVLVVGTWLHSANAFLTYRAWRKENAGVRTPIATVGVLATWVVWDIASVGLAAELLAVVIPWSMGAAQNVNPLLARTLYWYFGGALGTFWLLPAFLSWHAMLPRQAGSKLFSDSTTRLAFFILVAFATVSGLQHQVTDPGIDSGWKGFTMIAAFVAALPAFMILFTVVASLEYGGRQRGSKSMIGWMLRLPWGDPSFVAQMLALFVFGISTLVGVISASYTMGLVVANTTWDAGAIQLSLGTVATLSFIGVSYWLLPYLMGRQLASRPLALGQIWLWLLGSTLSAFGLLWGGLLGAPNNTPFAQASYTQALIEGTRSSMLGGASAFQIAMGLVAGGGVILFLSGGLYLLVVLGTLAGRKATTPEVVPLAESLVGPEKSPASLDNWRMWVGTAIFLVILVYGPVLIQVLQGSGVNTPGLIIK